MSRFYGSLCMCVCVYTVYQRKRATLLWRQFRQILTNFQNSFTVLKPVKF